MIRGEHGRLRYYAEPASGPGKPLVIHLHGIGERHASNLDRVLRYGPVKLINDGLKLPDATYVQPQLPSGNWEPDEVNALFQHIIQVYQSDVNALHLMGVSLGGFGVRIYLASSYGPPLASAVLMSPGGGNWTDAQINSIADSSVPIWISHAANDKANGALYQTSLDAVTRLRVKGTKAELRFTSLGLSGHATGRAWGRFMKPDNFYLWDWLISQRKQSVDSVSTQTLDEIKAKLITFIGTL